MSDIYNLFKTKISEIFGKSLAFGFVFGSSAKGTATEHSDIDMFICLSTTPLKETMDRFVEWYQSVHSALGRIPDMKYPGEVMTSKQLIDRLNRIQMAPFTKTIAEYSLWEAFIWLSAMVDTKTTLTIGNKQEWETCSNMAIEVANYWKRQLSNASKNECASDEIYELIKRHNISFVCAEAIAAEQEKNQIYGLALSR